MSDLVQRLSQGMHPVEASLRPDRTVAALKECIDRGYVLIRFTGTRGGTELGVALDRERSKLAGADFEKQSGSVTIVGDLMLDFVKVRCIADIDLPSLAGQGRLEPLQEAVAS
jgi:hypothetical protein